MPRRAGRGSRRGAAGGRDPARIPTVCAPVGVPDRGWVAGVPSAGQRAGCERAPRSRAVADGCASVAALSVPAGMTSVARRREADSGFEDVTETTGTPVSPEGASMMYTRYWVAAQLGRRKRVLEL